MHWLLMIFVGIIGFMFLIQFFGGYLASCSPKNIFRIVEIEFANGSKSYKLQKYIFGLCWFTLPEWYFSNEYDTYNKAVAAVNKYTSEPANKIKSKKILK